MASITRWDPFRGLMVPPRWFEEMEETASRGLKIHETENDIVAEAVVAGIPANDVEVNIEDGVLTIKAEASEETKKKGQIANSSYQYYYTAALSGGQWDKAEAEIENGVITVKIPKAEASKPRKITVKTKTGK